MLKFFYGPMDCGKSTLALQMDYNHARQGRLNARIVAGAVARVGEQVVIGDTDHADVRYQVLCRRHHRSGDLGPDGA